MPDFTQRPTQKFIDDAYLYYSKLWSKAHAKWQTYDEYYNRTFKLWDTASDAGKFERPSYHPSTARNRIDHAADAQMAYLPRVRRDPVGDREDSEENADLFEVGMRELLTNSGDREMYLPWKQAGRHMLQYGYFVAEGPYMDLTHRPEKPTQRRIEPDDEFAARMQRYEAAKVGWNPFRIKMPNPATYLLDPNEKDSPIAIKTSWKLADDWYNLLLRKKRDQRPVVELFDTSHTAPWKAIECREVWTKHWHAIRGMGKKGMYVERNTRGFVPGKHAYAGFGMEPVKATEIDPAHMARGLLDGVLDSLKIEAQAATAKQQMLLDKAFGELLSLMDPKRITQQQAAGANILQLDPNTVGRMPVNEYDRSLVEIFHDIKDDIEEGTFARPLGGYRESGVVTVGQQIMLSHASKTKLAAPARQIEIVASAMAAEIAMMVDTVPMLEGRVRKLRKGMIQGSYETLVTFEVNDPVLDLERKRFGLDEMRQGAKDLRTYLEEDARVDNVHERMRRLNQESVERHPSVRKHFQVLEAKAMGLGNIFDADVGEEDAPPTEPTDALDEALAAPLAGPNGSVNEQEARVALGPGARPSPRVGPAQEPIG